LSFFDEDDEPRSRPQPRRGAPAGGAAADRRTLLLRQAFALGAFVLFLLVLFFGVRSCANSRKESSLKDYTSAVAGVVRESDTQVGAPFFALLGQAGEESPQDLQTNISGYRIAADTQLKQARGFDVPDEMQAAQRSLLIALEFRRDGLGFIAQRIRTALGDAGTAANDAIVEIAGQMQAFLASDVIYRARVAPLIKRALSTEKISGQRIPDTKFLPGVEWLSEKTVAAKLGQTLSGGSKKTGTPAPGLHGTGLDSVTVGGTRLNPDAPNRLPAAANTAFVVKFVNQGENDEFDVRAVLRIEGGPKPLRVAKTVDTVARGQTAEVTLELGQKPPTGTAVTVTVEVAKVPGEQKVDNNKSSYDVLFTEG
jgi:hypothetical protein